MRRHASILIDAGFEVTLIGRERQNSVVLTQENFEQVRLKTIFDKGKLFYLEYNLRLFWFLLKSKAEIFLSVDFDTLLANSLASKLLSKKLVFDAHEYFTEVPEVTNRFITKSIWEFIGNLCVPYCDSCYTVGPELAKIFSSQYHIEFKCVLNVPNYQTFRPEPNPTEKIILYQGALNAGRGIAQLIEAMPEIDGKLWIAGEGDLSSELRALAKKMKLDDKVVFHGFLNPVQLENLTKQAYIGCNVLESKGLSYQYSLANKFFDYLHANIPQICADFIEYQKINQEFEIAILCECNAHKIANAINLLLNDAEKYRTLKNNCEKASRVYNLQAETKKITQIFHSL